MTTNKFKRTIIFTAIFLVIELVGSNAEGNKTADFLNKMKDPEVTYLSNVIDSIMEFTEEDISFITYDDELEQLMNKFNLRYSLRDYFRQICALQNVDPLEAISVMNIESWCCNHDNYKNRTKERAYMCKGEVCWDDGAYQLTSYSEYRQEQQDKFYNPELIFSLGYVRDSVVFDANDDISNIQVGVAYLGYLYRYYGDYYTATMAFNVGMGNVNKGDIPNITKQYAHAIKHRWSRRQGDI